MTPDPVADNPAAKADGHGRRSHGEQTRERIIEAAVELFGAQGFRGTGVAALAKRVGMTGPGLLYYFGTKERLLAEVIAERDRADVVESHDLLTLDHVRQAGEHAVRTAAITRLYLVLGAEAVDPTHPLHEWFNLRNRERVDQMRSMLERDVAAGRLRSDLDIDQLAHEIPATITGLQLQWLADPDSIDLASRVAAYVDRVVADSAPS